MLKIFSDLLCLFVYVRIFVSMGTSRQNEISYKNSILDNNLKFLYNSSQIILKNVCEVFINIRTVKKTTTYNFRQLPSPFYKNFLLLLSLDIWYDVKMLEAIHKNWWLYQHFKRICTKIRLTWATYSTQNKRQFNGL